MEYFTLKNASLFVLCFFIVYLVFSFIGMDLGWIFRSNTDPFGPPYGLFRFLTLFLACVLFGIIIGIKED